VICGLTRSPRFCGADLLTTSGEPSLPERSLPPEVHALRLPLFKTLSGKVGYEAQPPCPTAEAATHFNMSLRA